MIARVWRGRTPVEKADGYLQFLYATGLPDYQSVEGNRGVQVLRRIEGDVAEFVLISLWESEDALRHFAGDDYQRAVYPPRAEEYLLEMEPTAAHYEVVADF